MSWNSKNMHIEADWRLQPAFLTIYLKHYCVWDSMACVCLMSKYGNIVKKNAALVCLNHFALPFNSSIYQSVIKGERNASEHAHITCFEWPVGAAMGPAGSDKYLQTVKHVWWNYSSISLRPCPPRDSTPQICQTVIAGWLLFQCCRLWSSAAGRNSTASSTGPASLNAGDATVTRTARTAATRRTARAPKRCATPRPNSPATLVINRSIYCC